MAIKAAYVQSRETYGPLRMWPELVVCIDRRRLALPGGYQERLHMPDKMIRHQRYATRADAESAIKEYIEIFYNRQRRHSRLGYISPAQFVENFSNTALAA